MQTIEREHTIKALNEGIENGNIVFNHPMQRKPGQWDIEQQSLLIHSILANFAVPQTYALQMFDGDYDSFSVLDGKQRLTTIYDYMKDGFKLSEDLLYKKVAVIMAYKRWCNIGSKHWRWSCERRYHKCGF